MRFIQYMPDDISFEELDNIKQMMEGYISDFTNIDNNISDMIKNCDDSTLLKLETLDKKTKDEILRSRDKALSIGFIAISTMALLIRRFRSAAKLSGLFIQLINHFVSLITKYVGLFKIESIQVTISLTPSIVIIFKP